ncbi:MAG: class I SAM-dependent methyltransferase [Rhodocyclaceae bacterium]
MNMKGRESGMPDEAYWASFFEAEVAIDRLLGSLVEGNVIEFGCGYGSFTLPAARRATGRVTALDIEPGMVDCVRQKAVTFDLPDIQAEVRDFVAHGTGVATGSQAHAMIFNLLHLEQPVRLLREAYRTLQDDGVLSVIHWRSDIPTPRGPSLAIRPTPEQCRGWMADAGFQAIETVDLQSCCPFHFGLLARR